MIYVVNLNYIFLEAEAAAAHGVCGAKGCAVCSEQTVPPVCSVVRVSNRIFHLCLRGFLCIHGPCSQGLPVRQEDVLGFVLTNDHIIHLEHTDCQQVLMQAASKTSQQTM